MGYMDFIVNDAASILVLGDGIYTKSDMSNAAKLTHLPLDEMPPFVADENGRISIQIPLIFVDRIAIAREPALVQVMAWHRTGNKPLPGPMKTQIANAYMPH